MAWEEGYGDCRYSLLLALLSWSVVIQTIPAHVDPVGGDILPAIINPTFALISIHNTEPVTKWHAFRMERIPLHIDIRNRPRLAISSFFQCEKSLRSVHRKAQKNCCLLSLIGAYWREGVQIRSVGQGKCVADTLKGQRGRCWLNRISDF